MQCSKCKREFVDDEEVMVEGKGRYSVIKDAVIVTDQAAVFCQDCDKASYEEETAGREEKQLTGDAQSAAEKDPRDESNPEEEKDPMEIDPYKL